MPDDVIAEIAIIISVLAIVARLLLPRLLAQQNERTLLARQSWEARRNSGPKMRSHQRGDHP